MAIFRCKMCGGEIEITEGKSVCTCKYCGTEQTLPKLDSEIKANLYDRANHFRRNSDFDKAMEIYEQILNIDDTDAEAYWSLILCRYGIEYVEDPATPRRLPTINRAQYTSIYADENYKSALEYAMPAQKNIYEQEAKIIDELQKNILAISEKEEPFDVFICYKETDDAGRRTPDSVLANDLYHQLTQEGFKVFFARITLEDKLGCEYEPYIFAALNSAKVMVVLGTKPDYFKAVWVRNEWSRFLALIRAGEKKMLIPAYKDMDPHNLPEEFSHLQAQDMSKLGFMQDLIRGIGKIIGADRTRSVLKETVVYAPDDEAGVLKALIVRGNLALTEGDWKKADVFFEEALNQDAECAEAYLGKFLIKKELCNSKLLEQYYLSKYDYSQNEKCEACPMVRDHIEHMVKKYTFGMTLTEMEIRRMYIFDRFFESALPARKRQKVELLKELENDKFFAKAKRFAEGDTKLFIDNMMENICRTLDEQIEETEKEDREKKEPIRKAYEKHIKATDKMVRENYRNALRRFKTILIAVVGITVIILVCVTGSFISKNIRYNKAVSLMSSGNYSEAVAAFKHLDGYKYSDEQIKECEYYLALEQMNSGYYSSAIDSFNSLGYYRDSNTRRQECELVLKNQQDYAIAVSLMTRGNYEEAITMFESLNGYKDSVEQIENCNIAICEEIYNNAVEQLNGGSYVEAYVLFASVNDYKDSKEYMSSIYGNHQYEILANANIKDTVLYGSYNANYEWVVLDKVDGKLLLISKYAIEQIPYNTEKNYVTWERCSLRNWLNDTYFTSAFTVEEQARILETTNVTEDNYKYGTYGGNDTLDRVFLLSKNEVDTYFVLENDRQTTLSDGTGIKWWMRNPGSNGLYAIFAYEKGLIDPMGIDVSRDSIGVRPAMWIDISDL